MIDIKKLIFKKENESFNEHQIRKLKAKIKIKTLEKELLEFEIKHAQNKLIFYKESFKND